MGSSETQFGPWSLVQALSWLDEHVNLEAVVAGRPEPSLDRMRQLCALMGDPQAAYPVVHVTGTNGKGSTARMITALLATRGLAVGLYTSPDLERVNERLALAQGHIDPFDGEVDQPAEAHDDDNEFSDDHEDDDDEDDEGADHEGDAEPKTGQHSSALGPPSPEPITDDELAALFEAVAGLECLLESRPTRFEILTAAAYRWFADLAVDVAVVEVGVGGLYDATNVAEGDVAVVTNVSLDHEDIFGPGLDSIAREKAGIVKPGSTLVLGETNESLASIFRAAGAERTWKLGKHFGTVADRVAVGGRLVSLRTPGGDYEDIYLPAHGAHQATNATVALTAAEAFFGGPLPDDVVTEAFASLSLPGRMEVIGHHPLIVLDGAHNLAGARAAGAALSELFPGPSGLIAVVGMLQGRDPTAILDALGLGRARLVVACPAPSPRTLPAEAIAVAARSLGVEATETGSVAEALDAARGLADEDHCVLVTGSLYVVGAARGLLSKN